MEFILALLWLAVAGFTVAIAESKFRSQLGWLALGVVFGPLALISVGLMEPLDRLDDAPRPATHVKCPDCRELVLKEARVCKHCGCRLAPMEDPA
jgi:hypothetical protein